MTTALGQSSTRWGGHWPLACALLLGVVLRLYHLTASGFWVDEIITLDAVRVVREVSAGHLLRDLHGPLYTAALALGAEALSGERLRLISALAGALAVLPVHAWARRVSGERSAALVAWLAALSPFAVWYSQELRNYSFVLLLAASCLWAAERWRERGTPRWGDFALFVGIAWLGLLANLTFALLLLGLAVALLVAVPGRRRRQAAWLGLAALLLALLSLPWIRSFVETMAPQRLVLDVPGWSDAPLRGAPSFSPMALPYTFYALLMGFSWGPSLGELHGSLGAALGRHSLALGVAGLVLAPLMVLGFARQTRSRRWEIVAILAVCLGLATALALKNFKVYNVRYVSMVWPLLLLLLADGILALRPRRWRQLATALVLGLFAGSLAQYYWNPAYAKEDVRGAARRLAAEAEAVPVVVAVVGAPFDYYFRGNVPTAQLWPGMRSDDIRAKVAALGEPARLKLVSARDWEWGGSEALLRAFTGYREVGSATLRGVRIYTLEKRP